MRTTTALVPLLLACSGAASPAPPATVEQPSSPTEPPPARATVAAKGDVGSAPDGTAYAAAVQQGLQGQLAALENVLELDASLAGAAISSTGATALHFAAAKGQVPMARLLLYYGASVTAKTAGGATPLAMACSSVELDAAALLIEHGAREPACGAAALHAAVARSKARVVESLLRGGAEPSIVASDDGKTPLHIAAITGDAAIASVLLRHGASHEARFKTSGETPLHIAAIKSHADVVAVLLAAGADAEARSTGGQTPLHAAATHGDAAVLESVLEALCRGGSKVSASSRRGGTALHEVAARGLEGSVRLLLAHGASADQADAYGDTALTWAVSRGHVGIVRLLVERGGATLLANAYGSTALHAAAYNQQEDVLRTLCDLLPCGGQLSAEDTFGDTPGSLYTATSGHAAAVALRTPAKLDGLLPPLPAEWQEAASRMASESERRLLVLGEAPEAVSADSLIRELALMKQSLTFDRRVRSMLHSPKELALLSVSGALWTLLDSTLDWTGLDHHAPGMCVSRGQACSRARARGSPSSTPRLARLHGRCVAQGGLRGAARGRRRQRESPPRDNGRHARAHPACGLRAAAGAHRPRCSRHPLAAASALPAPGGGCTRGCGERRRRGGGAGARADRVLHQALLGGDASMDQDPCRRGGGDSQRRAHRGRRVPGGWAAARRVRRRGARGGAAGGRRDGAPVLAAARRLADACRRKVHTHLVL